MVIETLYGQLYHYTELKSPRPREVNTKIVYEVGNWPLSFLRRHNLFPFPRVLLLVLIRPDRRKFLKCGLTEWCSA